MLRVLETFAWFSIVLTAMGGGDFASHVEKPGSATVDGLEIQIADWDAANDQDWAETEGKAELAAKCSEFRETFRRKTGYNGIEPAPVNARSFGVTGYDGFRIEKILLESAPGAYVTALVFLPDEAKCQPPYAGFMFIPGHSGNGKAQVTYMRTCELGARNGLAAIVYDPLGQGERSQGAGLRSADEHVRVGAYAALLGETTATYMLRDAKRVFDYFAGRDDVDETRLGVSGNSGGGTLSAFFMVADDRVKAAAPSCYLSSVREHLLACGPQDAEQNFFDETSWGFNHAAFVLSAGCPVLINAAVEDFFQIAGSRSTYRLVKGVAANAGMSADRFALSEAPGPHTMSRVHRERAVEFMLRHLKGENRVVNETVTNVFAKADWTVSPDGEVSRIPGFRSIYEMLEEKFVEGGICVECAASNAVPLVRRELAGNDCKAVLHTLRGRIVPGEQACLHLGGTTGENEASMTLFADGGRYMMKPSRRGKLSYYERRGDDEVVAVDLYVAGRSLVALRAAELIVAARELEKRTGRKPMLMIEGRYTVPAKFALAAGVSAFGEVVFRNEPKSWLESLRRREYLSFADSGAIYAGGGTSAAQR